MAQTQRSAAEIFALIADNTTRHLFHVRNV
ncbi:hypothetical protein LCGC14_1795740 [marine sediment metagenome]|uniref:Uncharacterized protein n=1 Tax=marine sediment metagenome TaxID=412755 RepID=A0A0F9JQS9_9ZZZZ